MRSAWIAVAFTAGCVVKKDMITSAATKKNTVTMLIKMALYFAVFKTDSEARCGWPAPRFCPTNVAAALLNPHAGSKKNMRILMAIIYPAEATLPPVSATHLVRNIQLQDPIMNCKVPGPAIITRLFITLH